MNPVKYQIHSTALPADTFTPVGIYLRLRDVYPQCLLLECADYSSPQNAFSYISFMPVAGMEVKEGLMREYAFGKENVHPVAKGCASVAERLHAFVQRMDAAILQAAEKQSYPGLMGYTTYNAVQHFEDIHLKSIPACSDHLPELRYDLYGVVIAFNHFYQSLEVMELQEEGRALETPRILSLLANRNAGSYPFKAIGTERQLSSDAGYMEMVRKGIAHCARGDVFQIVLSRRCQQDFIGDDFNVYRALRSINPSPYLFYFDYIDYRLMGSSPEAQLQVEGSKASINPIAGTVGRSGNPEIDHQRTLDLLANPKENAEHAMLVDLARNDLSRHAFPVSVDSFRQVHTYSHVIHLVSVVSGVISSQTNVCRLFGDTFPAGTLTGAPKYRAMQLIDHIEGRARGYYGGAIGIIGLQGKLNHAILIRSFLSKDGVLSYQSGAGVVINSTPEGELAEVNQKIEALRKAVKMAETF